MAVAFILKGYPRLSETFIAQEIRGLEQRGLDIRIYSMRHPTDKARHPIHSEITAPVSYLPEYLHDDPLRVFRAWRKVRRLPGYGRAFWTFVEDLKRDRTRNRIRRFGQACVLAAELPDDVDRLHFHFLHTPASVVRYAALMTKLPWSGSAHAKDIWTSPEWELREKLIELDWVSTCTSYGADYLRKLAGGADKVSLDYHGLDLARFDDPDKTYSPADGSDPDHAVTLLSVGRAVPKKGYDDLMAALAKLPGDLNWKFIHIGGGTLSSDLKDWASTHGVADRITWMGAQPQEVVLEQLRQSDIFVLASKISGDGDRDGLPNVLMEAQSQGVTVAATQVSAIPELILDGETGLLCQPEDPEGLAEILQRLITDPELRKRLGRAGNARVRERFEAQSCLTGIAARFGLNSAKGQEKQDGKGVKVA